MSEHTESTSTDARQPARTFLIAVEHVVWEPGDEWAAAVGHLAARFARAHALDADAVLAHEGLATQMDALDAWASQSGADLDRELGRWLDEHLAMHLRPDPSVTRAVRALAGQHRIVAISALPPRPAEAIARHAGVWRSFADLVGDVRSAEAVRAVAAEHEAGRVVADTAALRAALVADA